MDIMRRRLWSAVVLTALAVCLSGCGAREQQKGTTVEKSRADAIIQNARINNEEQQKAFLEEHAGVVLTERCLYEYDAVDDVIVQMDYEGNELNRFPINEEENCEILLCGSDKRLILSKYVKDDTLTLYSVPVLQTEDGETVRWEQEEKITSCYEEFLGPEVVLYEPFLLYKEDSNTLVRLDMETGERKNFTFPLTDLAVYRLAYIDDYLYLVNKKDNDVDMDSGKNSTVYRINIAEGTAEKLYECEKQDEQPYNLFVNGQFLYMLVDNGHVMDRIECFDMEQKKTVGQLSVREIECLIKEEVMTGSVEECWEFDLDGISIYAGRFYIMASTSWLKEKGVSRETAIPRTALLSCSAKEMTDLKYEQDLTEWFKKQGCDKTVLGLGIAGDEDNYYFQYELYEGEKTNISHLMRYHLDTKQIEEVDEKELIRKLLCCE